ncbi:MAG: CusA/CzcA family heavy metal efflux RND transporter [Hydrogenothermaceae bacterium]|nr:CusA/CzcA family heavy metal efflux RND transporter [Hydrogenothermaceae bacterium]
MERFINFLLRYRLVFILLFLSISIYGYYSFKNVPIDAIPDLTDNQVIIYSEWKGQTPSVIEQQLAYPLVTSMIGLPKVKTVRSFSMANYNLVYVIFEEGVDLYWCRSRVLEKLSTIRNQLPDEAQIKLGPDATGVGWIYQYALYSKKRSLDELWSIQNFYIKYQLQSVENVAEVASVGGFEKEYRFILNPEKLNYYNISLEEVVKAINSSNIETGGKYIEINGREFLIKSGNYIKDKEEIENSVVKDINGIPIRLKDLGRVIETPALRMGTGDLNGEGNTVGGIVIVRQGANVYKTLQEVKEKLNQIKNGLPEDVVIVPVYDRSDLIERSINYLKKVIAEESIVVILIITLFLSFFLFGFIVVIFLVLSLLITFIVIWLFGVTSNIMSLAGIVIAIGTMVDACIVIIENFVKKREEGVSLEKAVIDSSKEVIKPIFFALLIVAVSFVPMFFLKGQAGKLFTPLVFTKTISMLIASVLTFLLIPILLYYFGKYKTSFKEDNFIVRYVVKFYSMVFSKIITYRYLLIILSFLTIPVGFLLSKNLEKEFMPPLREGSLMYMPIIIPGISISEAQRLLTIQDRIIKSFPEVETVFGKAGRSDSPTDPAPLSMIETIITLKPQEMWREGVNYETLISELDKALTFPGVVNSWTMPIKGRIDMITTGIRTPLGIKVYGDDIPQIVKISKEIEKVISDVDGIASVYAERSNLSTYITITPDRNKLYYYGISERDLTDYIELLFANKPITTYISGRERYSITLGIPRDYRQNIEDIKIPVLGKLIPLTSIADIKKVYDLAEIKSENGLFVSYLYITPKSDADITKIVQEAERKIKQMVNLPVGYYYTWSGEYQYYQGALNDLKFIVPIVLISIIILVYLALGRIFETFIVLITLPSSVIGGLLLMYIMGYKLSIASIAGFLSLLGISAEMSIIMLVYIMNSLKRVDSSYPFEAAVYEGAVKRIRPKLMTFFAISLSLIPAVLLSGTGSEVISRIAVPMVGGVITSFITSLFIIPAFYFIKQDFLKYKIQISQR